MDITLANFQIKAIADLTAAMEQENKKWISIYTEVIKICCHTL